MLAVPPRVYRYRRKQIRQITASLSSAVSSNHSFSDSFIAAQATLCNRRGGEIIFGFRGSIPGVMFIETADLSISASFYRHSRTWDYIETTG